MKRQPLAVDPVFADPRFAERYAKEQQRVFKWMHPAVVEMLRVNGFKGGRVLDDGCGPGYHTVGLRSAFPDSEIIGIDLSEPLLEIARTHMTGSGINGGVSFQFADVLRIPFDTHSFDAVICIFMFHLVEDPEQLCDEIERVLKPRGQLVMIDLRRNWLLSLLEREMRSSFTLPEALQIIKRSKLRTVTAKQTAIWWGVMG